MKFHSSVLALATLLAATDAFVPSSTGSVSSTFVRLGDPTPVETSTRGYGLQPMVPVSSSTRQATVLHASLLDRFFKVAQSNILTVVKHLESPEKIMNQAMIDMQNDLVKVRQSYAEISANQKRLLKQREAAESRGQDWYVRAQLALRSGNDALAKEALYRRQQQLDGGNGIQPQIETQSIAADKLFEGIRSLEVKIQEARQRKDEFIARAKAAESTTQVNDMLSGLTGKTSMDAFIRMEEKVEALEAAAEASAEMVDFSKKYLSGETTTSKYSIENEFLLLESNAAVDEAFKKLKTKMLSVSTTMSYGPSIEQAFSRLKTETVKIPVRNVYDRYHDEI
jgi:phage shock protein A